jgi:hypothetical protein
VLVGVAAWVITVISSPLLEYQDFKRIVKHVVANSASYRTVQDARSAYNKSAGLNHLNMNLSQEELKITKSGSNYVFDYNYERRAHLVSNVSLVFEFKGTIR